MPDEAAMRALGASLASELKAGDLVLLEGELGAGKTTLVRGLLGALGISEGVRSPTFNLMQVFETTPPVLHADLYRLKSAVGVGLEDYLDSHLCLIEWPDRATWPSEAIRVEIQFAGEGRVVKIHRP